MKRKMMMAAVTAVMSVMMGMTAFAGDWKSDVNGWWRQNDDASYPTNTWQWIDGNKDGVAECYYFDAAGYCLMNTTTPDNFQVNENGAWVVNGVVQTQTVQAPQPELTAKANLQDITLEDFVRYDHKFKNNFTYGGEDWNGASQYRVGNGGYETYADFYLGSQYEKLAFKVNPRTDDFTDGMVDILTVFDQQTGEVLETERITRDTRKLELEVDVTGVEYLRIQIKRDPESDRLGFGYVLVKDAILY